MAVTDAAIFIMNITATTLHTYFSNKYKQFNKKSYLPRGKGVEFANLKRLMDIYTPYQVMVAIDFYVDNSVDTSVSGFSRECYRLVSEYADDPIIAKAKYAIGVSKNNIQLREAYYAYVDALDSWQPSARDIRVAAINLEEMADSCLS